MRWMHAVRGCLQLSLDIIIHSSINVKAFPKDFFKPEFRGSTLHGCCFSPPHGDVPAGGDDRDEQQHGGCQLNVHHPSDQGPLDTHFADSGKKPVYK